MENSIENLLDEIGHILASARPARATNSLLLVQIGDHVASVNIFDDLGDSIRYRPFENYPKELNRLVDLLFELQRAHDVQPAWCEMDYFLQGYNFKASFRYADEVDPERDTQEIERDLLRPYFGERPVDYPPIPSVDGYDFSL